MKKRIVPMLMVQIMTGKRRFANYFAVFLTIAVITVLIVCGIVSSGIKYYRLPSIQKGYVFAEENHGQSK